MRKPNILLTALLAGLILLPFSTGADDLIINSTAADDQIQPVLAADGSGALIAAWISDPQDNDLPGIYGRFLTSEGLPTNVDFRLNSFWAPHERPRIAMTDWGGYVVVGVNYWFEGDTSAGVCARLFAATGEPLTQEFQVNQTEAGFQGEADVAIDAKGGFVVVWQSDGSDGSGYGIVARRYDSKGTPLSGEFQVNAVAAGHQMHPTIAMHPDGDFLVAWASADQDGDKTGIYACRFDGLGNAQGGAFRVNTGTVGWQEWPAAAMDGQGGTVICWQSFTDTGDGYDIFARTYDRTATQIGPETRVNDDTAGWQLFPAVDTDAGGDFLIAWQGRGPGGGDYGIYARLFDRNSQPLDAQFRVDDGTGGTHEAPTVSLQSRLIYTILWQGRTDDVSGWDIRGRAFRTPAAFPGFQRTKTIKRDDKKKHLHYPPRTLDRDDSKRGG